MEKSWFSSACPARVPAHELVWCHQTVSRSSAAAMDEYDTIREEQGGKTEWEDALIKHSAWRRGAARRGAGRCRAGSGCARLVLR